VVGIGWYAREEWEKMQTIADDQDELDMTYKEWLQQTKHTTRMLRQKSFNVEPISKMSVRAKMKV
jgi:hypothetical protein